MAAALAVTGAQANAATFDYYGQGFWISDYIGQEYAGGFVAPGLRVTLEIDEAVTGPLIDQTLSSGSVFLGQWYRSSWGQLYFFLTFDAAGLITDWQMQHGDPGTVGWISTPVRDYYSDDAVGHSARIGVSFGPGAWNDPSPVPLPASGMMLLAAMFAVFWRKRKTPAT